MTDIGRSEMREGHRPTISDVSRCYRLLLGREVESVSVAGQQIATSSTFGDLFERIWRSEEAVYYRMGEAFAQVPELLQQGRAEFRVAPDELAQIWDETLATWRCRGFGSYHHWLRRNEKNFDDRSTRWNVEQVLNNAEGEAAGLVDICRRHGRPLGASDAVAVFGSQAFRLGAALAPQIGSYTCYEAIPEELEQGAHALATHGHTNVHDRTAVDLREEQSRFDLFYSASALQYAPPPMIADIVRLALTALKPGGMFVCQLACQLHGYRFDPAEYLAGVGKDAAGEIHALGQSDVLAIIDRNDAMALEVIPDGRIGLLGISFTFVARKRM